MKLTIIITRHIPSFRGIGLSGLLEPLEPAEGCRRLRDLCFRELLRVALRVPLRDPLRVSLKGSLQGFL